MSNILISSEELRTQAGVLRASKGEMASLFSQIQSRMRLMSIVWNSPAGNRCIEQFETLTPAFEQYIQLVENYCLYLDQTAAAYQENEEMLGGMMA